jgi:hypothetical protein
LDANANNATGAINDSSLGSVNGPLTDTGAVNAYVVTCAYGTPSAYNNGMTVFFKPTNTNTGPSTLTVSPLSSLPITATDGTALAGGELAAGVAIGLVCDGTAFRIFSFQGPSQIWSVRLRSFNAIGNPNMETDQANIGAVVTNAGNGARIADRWFWNKVGTMTVNSQQLTAVVPLPGTNFAISKNYLRLTLTGQEASLAASDFIAVYQYLEGPQFRELINDVHSVQVLVRSSVAPLKFGIGLADAPANTQCLTQLATISTANTWTLLTFPNMPVFPAGNFSTAPGTAGQLLRITLAAGSTVTNSANGVWVAASGKNGALGQDNWCAQALNSTFDIAFIQWEPGSQCTTLQDKPWSQNYAECLRYFQKSNFYTDKPGLASVGYVSSVVSASTTLVPGLSFRCPMAKLPTVSVYNASSGALNSVWNATAGTSVAVSSIATVSDGQFSHIGLAAAQTAGQLIQYFWSADTGW